MTYNDTICSVFDIRHSIIIIIFDERLKSDSGKRQKEAKGVGSRE